MFNVSENWDGDEFRDLWYDLFVENGLWELLSKNENRTLEKLDGLAKDLNILCENYPRQQSIIKKGQRILYLVRLGVIHVLENSEILHDYACLPVFWENLSEFESGAISRIFGYTKPVGQPVAINVPSVENNRGIITKLTLELITPGMGRIYQAPEVNSFLVVDKNFEEVIDNVKKFLTIKKLWPAQHDISWSLKRYDEVKLSKVSDNSIGAAFLTALLVLIRKNFNNDNAAQYLNLKEGAISASCDERGNFGYIDKKSISIKLKSCIELSIAEPLRWIILCTGQKNSEGDICKDENLSGFRIIFAENVEEAIIKIQEHQKGRETIRIWERQCCKLAILGRKVSISHYVEPLLSHVNTNFSSSGREYLLYLSQLLKKSGFETKVPKIVVIAKSGYGKSTLCFYLSWKILENSFSFGERKLLPIRVDIMDWFNSRKTLPLYLGKNLYNIKDAPSVEEWELLLATGDVFLFFDGLEQISPSQFYQKFQHSIFEEELILKFPNCPILITCREDCYNQYPFIHSWSTFRIEALTKEDQDIYIFQFPAQSEADYDYKIVYEKLKAYPKLRELASNPMNLSILCTVVGETKPSANITNRGHLYANLIKIYLGRAAIRTNKKRYYLEQISFHLFVNKVVNIFYPDQYRTYDNSLDEDIFEEFRYCGLLQNCGNDGYGFPHLSLQEYLAAAYIARKINENDWDSAEILLKGKNFLVKSFIQKISWHSRWSEVIIFLSGLLNNPVPLLDMLLDSNTDDLFRHRLTLAVLCLSELQPDNFERREDILQIIEKANTEVFYIWWWMRIQKLDQIVPHLSNALNTIAKVRDGIRLRNGQDIFETLIQLFQHQDTNISSSATDAICHLAEMVVKSEKFLMKLEQIDHYRITRIKELLADRTSEIMSVSRNNDEIEVVSLSPQWTERFKGDIVEVSDDSAELIIEGVETEEERQEFFEHLGTLAEIAEAKGLSFTLDTEVIKINNLDFDFEKMAEIYRSKYAFLKHVESLQIKGVAKNKIEDIEQEKIFIFLENMAENIELAKQKKIDQVPLIPSIYKIASQLNEMMAQGLRFFVNKEPGSEKPKVTITSIIE